VVFVEEELEFAVHAAAVRNRGKDESDVGDADEVGLQEGDVLGGLGCVVLVWSKGGGSGVYVSERWKEGEEWWVRGICRWVWCLCKWR
jgi:hypothetical protein